MSKEITFNITVKARVGSDRRDYFINDAKVASTDLDQVELDALSESWDCHDTSALLEALTACGGALDNQ